MIQIVKYTHLLVQHAVEIWREEIRWLCTTKINGSSAPISNKGQEVVCLYSVPSKVGLWGRRGSVVACATYKREIAGSIPGCAEYVPTLCS